MEKMCECGGGRIIEKQNVLELLNREIVFKEDRLKKKPEGKYG